MYLYPHPSKIRHWFVGGCLTSLLSLFLRFNKLYNPWEQMHQSYFYLPKQGFIGSRSPAVCRHLFVRNFLLTAGYSAMIFAQTLIKDKSDHHLHWLAQASTSKVIETPAQRCGIVQWWCLFHSCEITFSVMFFIYWTNNCPENSKYLLEQQWDCQCHQVFNQFFFPFKFFSTKAEGLTNRTRGLVGSLLFHTPLK